MHRLQLTSGVFIGCLLLGIGVGMLFDRAGAGTLIGLGTGFVLSGVVSTRKSSGASK